MKFLFQSFEPLRTFRMFKIQLVSLCCFYLCIKVINGQEMGQQCDQGRGVCAPLNECSVIADNMKRGILNHKRCSGFFKYVPIVCCPRTQPTTTTTTTIAPTDRVSARKCSEYKESAYDIEYVINLYGTIIPHKISNCVVNSVPLIIGGSNASPREFPHMALVGYEEGNTTVWGCGGTLISEQFVLTAAHCFNKRDVGPAKYIRLGEHDKSRTDDAESIDLNIIDRIVHPDYHFPAPYNDIGLLKMERSITFNGTIRPACLSERQTIATPKAIATGWGKSYTPSEVLQRVGLLLFNDSECSSAIHRTRTMRHGFMSEIQICAGSRDEWNNTCTGDSGGPLQIAHPNCIYEIVGVTSTGPDCGILVGTKGVYTRVYPYLNWIENIVWPYE